MKKTITIILILLMNISYSQNIQKLDSIIVLFPNGGAIKGLYKYQNDLLTGVDFFQKNNTDQWVLFGSDTINYNSDNLVSSYIKENEKTVYTYDNNQKVNTRSRYLWNTSDDDWILSSIKTYYYVPNSELIDYTTSTNNQGNMSSKTNYFYENNILTIQKEYGWNDDLAEWRQNPFYKYEYEYDTNNNLITYTEYYNPSYYTNNYDDTDWRNGDIKKTFQYDVNIEFAASNIPFEYLFYLDLGVPNAYPNNQLISSEKFDSVNDQTFAIEDTFNYYYSASTLYVNNTSMYNNFVAYPNPTINQVKFDITDFEKIEIYDIMGKLITKTKTNTVNMENVPNGTYLYRIQKGNETINGKIIKK